MSIALPGSVGLLLLLQEAFHHEDPMQLQLNLSKSLHGFLDNFWWLANDVAARPTQFVELIPDTCPATIRACDAACIGMGVSTLSPISTAPSHRYFGDSVFHLGSNASWSHFLILPGPLITAAWSWQAQWPTMIF